MGLLNKKANDSLQESEIPVLKTLKLDIKRDTDMDPFLEETKDFKRAILNGYNRDDVDDYIEIVKCNMSRVQKQLSEEIRGITAEKANVINERNVLRAQLKEAEKEKNEALESVKDIEFLKEDLKKKQVIIHDLKAQNDELLIAAEKVKKYRDRISECEDHIRKLEKLQKEKEEQILALQKDISENDVRPTKDYEKQIHEMMKKYDAERMEHEKTRAACNKAEENLERLNVETEKYQSDIRTLRTQLKESETERNNALESLKNMAELKEQLKESETERNNALESLKDMAVLEKNIEDKTTIIHDLEAQNDELLIAAEKFKDDQEKIAACENHIKELEELQKEKEEQILALQKDTEERVARTTKDYEDRIQDIMDKYDTERMEHEKTRAACNKAEEELCRMEKENQESSHLETVKELERELEEKNQKIVQLENAVRNHMSRDDGQRNENIEMLNRQLQEEQERCQCLEKQIDDLEKKLVTENAEKDCHAEEKIREQVKAQYEEQISHLQARIKNLEEDCNKTKADTEKLIETSVKTREKMLKIDYEERLRQSMEDQDTSVESLKRFMNEKCMEIRKDVENDVSKKYEEEIYRMKEKCEEAKKDALSFKETLEEIMAHIDEVKERETLRMEQSIVDRKKISDLLYEVAKVRLENSASLNDEEE